MCVCVCVCTTNSFLQTRLDTYAVSKTKQPC